MISDLKKVVKITGCGKRFLILLCLRCPFDAALTAAQASFLQYAFDALTRNDGKLLATACLTFGCANVCLFLYNGTIWSIYAPFVVRMESKLRVLLIEKITAFSSERIEATSHGEWLTRLNTDVQMPFSQPLHLPHAVNAILRIGVSAIVLWKMNPVVFGWIMLFVIPHIITGQFFIARAMPKLNVKSLEATAANTDDLNALITCADIATLYDAREYLTERFERSSLNLLKAKMKIRAKLALSDAILPMFGLAGYLTLLLVSAGWIADGQMTFGDLTAAFQFRGGVLIGAMMLINSIVSIQASLAGIRRLNATLYAEAAGADGRKHNHGASGMPRPTQR